ncbi:hypothetical protein, partial [Escherichia coli]|uniref:hypothetical protein n=1 Tax=Escherichia coli TaxID=562 RepID=UPI000AA6C549
MIDSNAKLRSIQMPFCIRPQYSCPCCEKVFSGKMPAHILPKSAVEPSVIAQVVISKYTDHLPL